jgi:hypothetical protein
MMVDDQFEKRKKYTRSFEQKAYKNEWQKRWWTNAIPEQKRRRVAVNRARYQRNHQTVLAAYGGKCVCCGEAEEAFLTLDHVNNDGKQHRAELGCSGGSSTE